MATYTLPNIQTGGSSTYQANSLADAESQAQSSGTWSPAAGTFGSNSGPGAGGGGGGGGGSTGGNTPSSAAAAMDQQLSTLIQALSATNEQDFQEKIREFNVQHDLALQQFGLSQQAQQFSQAATAAGLTGVYNGQPTLAAAEAQGALTGYYTPPNATLTSNATGGGAAGGGTALSGYAPGTVVRTAGNQFGVVGANGWVTPGDVSNPQIYAAIQRGSGIATVPDSAFQAATSMSSPASAPPAGGQAASGAPTSTPIQTLAGQQLQAQLSGMYKGQPTEAAREFNVNTGVDLSKLQASLSGPADYFKYLTAQNAGRNILSSLNGQPMPQAGPVGQTQPQNVSNILSGLGIGQPQRAAAQSGISQGGSQTGQTPGGGGITIPGFESFGSLPQPNQISITNWNALGPTGQSFMKGAYSAAGYDPNDLERQIMAQAPSTGAAPQTNSTTTSFANTGAQSLFA